MKIVSACLADIKCNYKGESRPNQRIIDLVKKGEAIPVCPEQLGGLPTPRIPAEKRGDKVFNKNGEDVTEYFVRGANEVLRIAVIYNCEEAILKSKSPSCGFGQIYDGNFTETLIRGNGITADLLIANGIKVYTEENFK
jgi:uncharacterized protein YbbK (DUF523 family)